MKVEQADDAEPWPLSEGESTSTISMLIIRTFLIEQVAKCPSVQTI